MMMKSAFLALLLVLSLPAMAEDKAAAPKTDVAASKIDVVAATADRVLGNPDAPVTIYEYASMTCSHCAAFHKFGLPTIKKELIETGKAKLIFRDFPLDNFAVKAAAMARCAPADKFYPLVSMIFAEQERWARASAPDEAVQKIGALAGMDPEYIKACMADEDLKKAMMASMQDAQKTYAIDATPTFIFKKGDERMMEYPDFTDAIKKAEEAAKAAGEDTHKH
jgi:protein-disulfide isomerase